MSTPEHLSTKESKRESRIRVIWSFKFIGSHASARSKKSFSGITSRHYLQGADFALLEIQFNCGWICLKVFKHVSVAARQVVASFRIISSISLRIGSSAGKLFNSSSVIRIRDRSGRASSKKLIRSASSQSNSKNRLQRFAIPASPYQTEALSLDAFRGAMSEEYLSFFPILASRR